MLASARMSAWRPAPLVGSLAANVSTDGRVGMGSLMGENARRVEGLHLKSGLGCTRQPGVSTIEIRERARPQHSNNRTSISTMPSSAPAPLPYKTWRCLACGYIYDEAEGWPDDGIVAGTRWEDIPAGWCCPECGARKEDFEMVEF